MAEDNKQLIRFLQSENARLQEENRRLAEEIREMRRYMKALLQVHSAVQEFTPEQDILELLDKTLDCSLALLDACDGSLMLTDEENEELVFVLVHGAVREVLPGHRFSSRQGVAGWVAAFTLRSADSAWDLDCQNDDPWRVELLDLLVTHVLCGPPPSRWGRGNRRGVAAVHCGNCSPWTAWDPN